MNKINFYKKTYSRVIVLLLSFSSTLCSSPTAVRTCSRTVHWSPVINSAAVLSSPYGRRVGGAEVIRTQSCMHFILQS